MSNSKLNHTNACCKTLKKDNASTLLKLQKKKTECKVMLGKDRAGKRIFQQSLQNQGLTLAPSGDNVSW
jgi:hypothetical protein